MKRTKSSSVARKGTCRICGCTEHHACVIGFLDDEACAWADRTKTLCTNPQCLAKAGKLGR